MPEMFETLVRPFESIAANLLGAAADLLSRGPETLRHADAEAILPDDLFAHPDVQTEWWYYTGHCITASGKRFGFEFVFFKRRTDLDSLGIFPVRALANPMYFAHFAVTDIERSGFRYEHRRSFNKPFDLRVSMSETSYDLKLGDWTVREEDGFHILHAALEPGLEFDAVLETGKPLVHNGDGGNGISRKTTGASAHFSFTRMALSGRMTNGTSSESFTGSGWMDREFGTWEQKDWDWFSIQFDDQTELMVYQYRDEDGHVRMDSTGTFVNDAGICSYLRHGEYSIEILSTWTSPRTGAKYPAGWRISVPSLGIEVTVRPVFADQELDTRGTTMIVYWEGACEVEGTRASKPVRGMAYVELVGYDRSHETAGLADFLFIDPLRRLKSLIS